MHKTLSGCSEEVLSAYGETSSFLSFSSPLYRSQVDADLPRMMYIEEQADFLGRTCSFCIPGWRQTKYEATRGPKR